MALKNDDFFFALIGFNDSPILAASEKASNQGSTSELL